MKRALFIDRDGVLNEVVVRDGVRHSPRNAGELRDYPGLEDLPSLKTQGFLLFLMTNQPDLERAVVDPVFLDVTHQRYQKKYQLDALYCSPFASNAHPMKKPNPGMLQLAAEEWDLDLKTSYFLGDTDNDTGAAAHCGCRSILWDRPYNQDVKSDFRVKDFAGLRTILCAPGT